MHGLDSVMNGVFVRELRSGAGGVGACCVVCSGQLPGISSRGTCCIGALCIETASKAQRWDVQRLLRKKGSTWCHLFLWTTFAARPDFCFPTLSPLHQHRFCDPRQQRYPLGIITILSHHHQVPVWVIDRLNQPSPLSPARRVSRTSRNHHWIISPLCLRCLGLSSVEPTGPTSLIWSRPACSPCGGRHPLTK